jgi:hypothetical protein
MAFDFSGTGGLLAKTIQKNKAEMDDAVDTVSGLLDKTAELQQQCDMLAEAAVKVLKTLEDKSCGPNGYVSWEAANLATALGHYNAKKGA